MTDEERARVRTMLESAEHQGLDNIAREVGHGTAAAAPDSETGS